MKIINCLLAIILLSACGNKKAEIVEEIKKTKNEWYEADTKRADYNSAANKLDAYHSTLEASKKYRSKQMEMDADTYKKAYETSITHLNEVSPDTLKDSKKLHSIAFKYEMKASDLKRRIDSLELELKKY